MLDKEIFDYLKGEGHFTLSEFIPTLDNEDGIFFLEDGTIGFIIECNPVISMSPDDMKSFSDIFNIDNLKEGDTVQTILVGSKNIDRILSNYMANKKLDNPLYRKIIENQVKFIKKSAEHGFFKHDGGYYRPRDFRMFVAFRSTQIMSGKGLLENLKNSFNSLFGTNDIASIDYDKEIKRVQNIRDKMKSLMKLAHTSYIDVSAQNLIDFYREIFSAKGYVRYDPDEYINLQAVDSSCLINQSEDDKLYIDAEENTQVGVMTVKSFPQKVYDISGIIGDYFNDDRQLPQRFLFTLNVRCKDQIRVRDEYIRKEEIGKKYSFKKQQQKMSEMNQAIEKLENGSSLHDAFVTIAVISDKRDTDFDQIVQKVKGMFTQKGYGMQIETSIKTPLFLSMLPLHYAGINDTFFDRSYPLFSGNLAALSPIYGDWKGNAINNPSMIFFARRGQVQPFNIFNATSYSGIIYGPPGKGKSFLLNNMIVSAITDNAAVFVTEVGYSFKKTSEILGGNYYDFSNEKALPLLNPFLLLDKNTMEEGDNDELNMLTDIFSYMISPKQELSQDKYATLQMSIRDAWKKHNNRTSIDDVESILMKKDQAMATALSIYDSKGGNKKYFKIPSETEIEKRKMVFNKQLNVVGMKSSQEMGENIIIISMFINIMQISKYVYKDKSVRKLVIFDEFHNVIDNPHIIKVFSRYAREFRKHNASLMIATQSLEDVYNNDYARVLPDTCNYKFMFAQKPETIQYLKANNKLAISDSLERLINSINTVPGVYSEFMIEMSEGKAITRFIVDRFTQLLFTTNAQEASQIEYYQEKGFPIEEAIEKVMEDESKAG